MGIFGWFNRRMRMMCDEAGIFYLSGGICLMPCAYK